jgi:hypothetical protein
LAIDKIAIKQRTAARDDFFYYGGNFSAVIFIEMISEQPA